MADTSKKVTVNTVCAVPDSNFCGLSVEVSDGVISKVRPYSFSCRADRGGCPKGLAAAELAYHPDRLRYPLKRVGERGDGKWKRVSWDEALDDIAARLKDISSRHGPASLAWVNKGTLAGSGYTRLASLTKGSFVGLMGVGDSAAPCADRATFGAWLAEGHICRIKDPAFSIVWGANPDVTFPHRMRRIAADRKKGGKVVVIDPRATTTAAHADEHIQIRPGTDGALALGMLNVVVKQGLQDEEFVTRHTVGPLLVRTDNGLFLRESELIAGGSQQKYVVSDKNSGQPRTSDTPGVSPALTGQCTVSGVRCQPAFQLLRDMVKEYTPERVAEITDIPAEVVRRLAVSYATTKPASIHRGWGLQRSFHSDLTCRAISTLAAITGNMNPQLPATFVLNWRKLTWPAGRPNPIPVMLLYDAITKGQPAPVKAVWFASHNFVNQMPDMNRTIKEVLPQLELIVVSDLFMTATARQADYVLPVSSFLECMDLRTIHDRTFTLTSTENTYLALQQKVIEPLYESKSDFQIAAGLAGRMGLAEQFNRTEEQCLEEVLASGHPTVQGITIEKLREGPVMLNAPDNPPAFTTPTGRIEFYVERLKPLGQELPVYLEPAEGARSARAKTYPLSLLTSHPRQRVHSTLANISSLRALDPGPVLEINPADGQARKIKDGDVVCAFNDRGKVKLKAKLTPGIKAGVVNIDQGWWPEQYIEGHHNQLTHQMVNQAQALIYEPNAALCDALVEVKKA